MANKQLIVEIVSDAKQFVSGLEESLGQITKIAKNANILGGVEDQIDEVRTQLKGLGDQLETALSAPKLDTSFFEDLNKRLDSVEKKYDSFRHTMSDMQNDLSKTDTARLSKEMDKLQESIDSTQKSFKDLQTVSNAFYSEKHELGDIKSVEKLKDAYEEAVISMEKMEKATKNSKDSKLAQNYKEACEEVYRLGYAIEQVEDKMDTQVFTDSAFDKYLDIMDKAGKEVSASLNKIESEVRDSQIAELLSGEMKEAQEAVKNFTLKDGKILVPLEVETTAAKLSKEIQGILAEVTERIKQSPISVKLDVDESAAVELRGKIEKMFDTISTELQNQYNKINTKNTSLVKDMGLSDYENSLKIISDNIATTSARISDLTKAFKDFGKTSGGALQIDTTSIDKTSQSVDELVTALSPQHLNDGQLRSRFESIEKSLEDMLDDGGLLKAKREEYERFFSLFDQYKSLGGQQTFASLFSGQTLDTSRMSDKEYLQSYQQQSEKAKQNLQVLREEYEKYVNAQTQGAADINAANEKTASGYVETTSVFKQLLEILDQISAKLNTLNFDQLGASLEVVKTIVTQFESLQSVLATGLEGFDKITNQINEVQTELKETRTVAEESKDALNNFTKDFDSKKVVDSLDKISNEYEEIAIKGKEISKVDMITDAQESVSEINRILDAFTALSTGILGVIDSIDRVGISIKELGTYLTDNTGLDTYFGKIQSKLGGAYANSDTQRIDLRSSKKEIQEVLDMYQQYKQMGGSKNLFDLSDNQQTVMKMQNMLNKSVGTTNFDIDLANQFTQQSAIIDKAIDSEIESIQVLKAYIADVTTAIESQNAALRANENQFASSIDSETTYLKVLLDYIEEVKNALDQIGNIQFKNTTEALKSTTDAAAGKSNNNAGKSASTAELDKTTEQVRQLISYYEQLDKMAFRFVEAQEAAQQGNASKNQLKVLDDYNQIVASIESINNGLTLTTEQQEKVNQAVVKHAEKLKESKEQLDKINKALEQQKADALTDKITKQQDALRKLKDELQNSGKYSGYDTLVGQIDDAINSAEILKAKIKNSGISEEVKEQADSFEKLTKEIDKTSKSYEKLDSADSAVRNLSRSMQNFLNTNTNLSDETIAKVQELLQELQNGPSKVDLERIANGFKDIKAEAQAAGQIGNTFFDQLGEKAKSFGAYLLTYVQFQDFIRYFKQGMEIVHDFDDALTEMMKVSDESMERLREYQKESFDMASSIGTTALTFQQSTADFMRLGESLDEASKSAKAANVLMNVSEFTNIQDATDSLIAMSYAYDDFEKMDIIDKLNNIGNNYAISTDGIATALQSSASALVTAGNDIDEAIALVTAGNTITQDPKKVGTGLRTIALRLTGTKEAKKELEEMGEDVEGMYETQSKLREDIMNATQVASNNFQGFDILNDSGNYKSTYEILLGIADIYDEIIAKDKEQGTNFSNFLLEAMAGKTRANILASIFQNADVLRESFEDAQNSFGSAMEENDKYMDSISGHIAQLTNSYQELWATSTNRETINFFIDLANAVVTAASKIGLLGTALTTIAGITILKGGLSKKGLAGSLISGLGSFAHLDGDTSTLAAAMNTLAENSDKTGESFSLLSTLSPQLSRGFARIKDAGAGLWQIIKSTAGSIKELAVAHPLLTGAIVAATVAIGAYILTYDKLNRSYKDTVDEIKQIRKEYNASQSDIRDHAKAISEVSDEYERLSKGVNTETNANISLSTDEYERYLQICNQIADMYPELVKGYDSQGNAILSLKGNVEGLTQALIDEKKAAAEAAINGGEAGDANSIMDAWRHVVNGKQTGYNKEMSAAQSVEYLNKVLNWENDDSRTMLNAFLEQEALGTDYDTEGLVSNFAHALRDGNIQELNVAKKAIIEEINSMNMEIEQRLSDVKFLGNMYLTNGDDYYGLSERGQTMGNLLVEGMSRSVAEGFIDGEKGFDKTKVDVWTDSIIKDIQKIDSIAGVGKDANGKDKTLLDNIFEFKTEDKTLSEIRNFRQKAIDAFNEAGVSNTTTTDFFEQIGLTEDRILDARRRAMNAVHSLVNKDLKDEMTSFNFGEMFSDMTVDQMEAFIEIANGSENASEALKKWNDVKKVSISLSEDLAHSLETEKGVLTGVQTAITEAASATGLSFGNKNYIQETFGAMEGYDYDKMFKRTATGIKLDSTFLNEMAVQRSKDVLADYNNELAATLSEEQRITEAMRNVEVGSEAYATGQKNLELLRERKQLIAEEITQYEALISTYNRWVAAQSEADSRSNWESMASGFERVDQLVNAGFIGDAEVKAWVDLLTYEDMATASVEEYMAAYEHLYDTIEGTSYTVKDFFQTDDSGNLTAQSLNNYVDALRQINSEYADLSTKTIDASNIDAFAQALGISKEMATELTFALKDIGWDVVGQQAIEAVADANRALEQLNAHGIFDSKGHHIEYQIDFNTENTAALDAYISDIRAKLDEFRNEDGTINFEAEGANELVIVMDALMDRYRELNGSRLSMDIETNAKEALDRLNELKLFGNLDYQINFDTTDINVIDHFIDEIRNKLAEISDRNSVNFDPASAVDLEIILDALLSKKHELTGEDVDFYIKANGAEETVQQLEQVKQTADEVDGKNSDVNVTQTGAEETTSKIKEAGAAADEVNGKDATIKYHSDTSEIDNASEKIKQNRAEAEAPVVQKVQTETTEKLVLDTTQAEADRQAFASEVVEAEGVLKISVDKTAVDEYMMADYNREATLTINADTVQADLAKDSDYNVEATVTFKKDSKEPDDYKPDDKDATVKFKKESSAPDNYRPSDKSATVTYNVNSWNVDMWRPPDKSAVLTYNIRTVGSAIVDGTAITNGHAYASGTAFAKGDWGTKSSGTALGGELGTELLVRDGKWQTIGEDGAEFFNFKKGDIIFNAEQTKQLFENGKITNGSKRGTAFAEGTAFASGSSYEQRALQRAQEQAARDAQRAAQNAQREQQRAAQQAQREAKQLEREAARQEARKKERELLSTADYIERLVNKLGRAIEKLNSVVEDTTRNWGTRNYNAVKEISSLNDQLANQKLAAQKYQKYLDGLQKSYGLTADRINMVKNGAWTVEDIYNMSARTGSSGSASQRDAEDKVNRKYSEGIQHYIEFYDKMTAAQDAAIELTSQIRELFIKMFDQISTNYLGQLQTYELVTGVINQRMETIEASGGIVSEKYYSALSSREDSLLTTYMKQRENMVIALEELVRNGTVGTNSEEYYRMSSEIDKITLSIEESKTKLAEFAAEIRNIRWEKFDRLQKSLENIVNESDFLIDLLEGEEESLYDKESGLLTDYGMAALGLHESNYEVYIDQAKRYANEITAINKELAEDPYNQELLERRQELLEAQQDSIAAAQDEKNTIKDLMTNTIEKEVESLKTLIKTYTDTLDAEKDLYNYQKNIRDKSKNVNDIRKQLSAYENDDSEEGRARRQQLEAQLADAEEALKDTQYDHYFSEHKELLDNLYTEYEKQAKERANKTDNLIKDTINAINRNSANISDTISKLASSYGYDMSDSLDTILTKDSSGKTDTKANTAAAIKSAVAENNAATNAANSNVDTSAKGSRTSYGDSRADGWYEFGGQKYYVQNGQQAKGLQKIEGKQYYFDTNTNQMATDQFVSQGGKKYYVGSEGTTKTGWNKINNKQYYMDKEGVVQTGWQTISGHRYNFGSDGAMKTGSQKIGGQYYLFNNKGWMQTGVQTVSGKKYLYDSSTGARAGNGKGDSWVVQGKRRYRVDKTGQVKANQWIGSDYYTDSNGAAVTGFKTINKKTYYFDPNNYGKKMIYEQTIGGKTYYFNGKGEMQTGWIKFNKNNKWRYFNSKGEMLKGWQTIDKKRYYLDPNGGWRATGWQTINGNRYYFDGSGVMQTGEKKIGQKYYYFNSSGVMQTGPVKVGNKTFLYGKDGAKIGGAKSARWVDFNGRKYYVNTDGSLKTSAWIGKKYVNGSGAMLTGWNKVGGKQYYFNGSGDKVTGWQTISGHRYNFGTDGVMKTGLQTIGGKKYHFNSKGWMTQNAWQTVSGKKYYFGNDGVAYTNGAKKIDGKGYYFDKNGIMQANTTVTINKKKYKIDKNGVIQGYRRGVQNLSTGQMAWTQEGRKMEAIIRPSDGAILTPLAKGDSVLNSKATANLFDFANDPQKFLRELKAGFAISPKAVTSSKDVNIKNDVNLQVVLPNVKNYEEFKAALQRDKNFENMIRSMTTDKMFGGSSLAKYKFA